MTAFEFLVWVLGSIIGLTVLVPILIVYLLAIWEWITSWYY